jgi:hydroxymethylpyrimidine/phosphomethylpyrimidine kinase
VLCLSGHDPTGGAGIQADIESCAANGAHACTVVTALTVQDSHNVQAVFPVAAAQFRRALAQLLADQPPQAIKIGLVASLELPGIIAELIRLLRVPVVIDPIARAGGGAWLADEAIRSALKAELFPLTTVLTPNAAEARLLAPAGVETLLDAGCANVLVTGGDEPGEVVTNRWYRRGRDVEEFHWPRLPHTFHGAGCTLAAALAARLAQGEPLPQAIEVAQRWTADSLRRARQLGQGRPIPGRWGDS